MAQGRTASPLLIKTSRPRQRKPKTSERPIYWTVQITALTTRFFRFTRACRKKGRWINIAICFGIDLQEIFRLGIRSDLGNLAGDDDVINTPNMYVVLCAIATSLVTYRSIGHFSLPHTRQFSALFPS